MSAHIGNFLHCRRVLRNLCVLDLQQCMTVKVVCSYCSWASWELASPLVLTRIFTIAR